MIRLGFVLALLALVMLAPASPAPRAAVGEGIVRTGGTPLGLVAAGNSLWELTCDRRCSGEARLSVGRILRIDPVRGRVLASARVSRPSTFAVGAKGVYVTDFQRGALRRFDPLTLRATNSLRLSLPFEVAPGDRAFLPSDVAIGTNAVWVATARGALARIDLHAKRVLGIVRLHGDATGAITVGDGAVWVAQDLLGIYRIDPRSTRVVARIQIGPRTRRFAVDSPLFAGKYVLAVGSWTRNNVLTGVRGVARIDTRHNLVKGLISLPSGPLVLTVGGNSLWVARVGGSQVERIEIGTGKIVGRFHADGVVHLAVWRGHVWVAARNGTITEIS